MTIALFDSGGDLAKLAQLHAAGFADAWTAKAIGDLLATPNCFAFASYNGRTADAPNGFVMARAVAGEAEILTLAVAPGARGRGLGCALVRAAALHAQSLGAATMFLEVACDNRPARALYDRLGFAFAATRKGYYDGGDALVLKATLPLSQ